MRKSFCLQSLHFRHTWNKEGRWDEPAQPVNGAASAHVLFPYKIVVVFIWEGRLPRLPWSWLLEGKSQQADLTSYKQFLSRNENQAIRVYFIIQTKAKEMYPTPFLLFNNLLMNALLLVIHQFREQGWRRGGTVVRALTSHHCGPGSNPDVDSVRLSLSQFLDILASLAIWLLVDRSSYSNSVMSLWLKSTGLR